MQLRSLVRFGLATALLTGLSLGSQATEGEASSPAVQCGYCLSTGICLDPENIPNQCPMYCGADTYVGHCSPDGSDVGCPGQAAAVCYYIE